MVDDVKIGDHYVYDEDAELYMVIELQKDELLSFNSSMSIKLDCVSNKNNKIRCVHRNTNLRDWLKVNLEELNSIEVKDGMKIKIGKDSKYYSDRNKIHDIKIKGNNVYLNDVLLNGTDINRAKRLIFIGFWKPI